MAVNTSFQWNGSGSDKGYTLVELLVVTGIMVVMTGVISLSVTLLFSKDGERVARTIDSQIAEARTAAMSKPGSYSIVIHTTATGTGIYIELEKSELVLEKPTPVPGGGTPAPTPTPGPSTKQRIDFDKDAKIIFGKKGALPAAASNGTITISFDKSNGSITKIVAPDGTAYQGAALDAVFEIKCISTRNANKSSSVLLMPVTGRHYIEQ